MKQCRNERRKNKSNVEMREERIKESKGKSET